MRQKIKTWLCKKIGHSFSYIDLLIFKLELDNRGYTVDLNTGEITYPQKEPTIICRRCKKELNHESFKKEV